MGYSAVLTVGGRYGSSIKTSVRTDTTQLHRTRQKLTIMQNDHSFTLDDGDFETPVAPVSGSGNVNTPQHHPHAEDNTGAVEFGGSVVTPGDTGHHRRQALAMAASEAANKVLGAGNLQQQQSEPNTDSTGGGKL